jgi:replicative DNA helicase
MQDMMAETPLTDVEGEQTVLAVILRDPTAMERVGNLTADDFSDPSNAALFAAMQDLRAERRPINTVSLRNRAITSSMGREAIMGLLNKLSFAGELPSVPELTRGIVELSLRRQLQETHRRYVLAAGDGSQPVPALLASIRTELDMVVARVAGNGVNTRLTHQEATANMMADLERDLSEVIVPCGIASFDRMIGGGFRRGDYAILAGRPGAGKSTVALALALGAADKGAGVLYITPEMSVNQLALRAAAAETGIPYERIASKSWSQREAEGFYRVMTNPQRKVLPIYYDGSPSLTAGEVQSRIKQCKVDLQDGGFTLDMVVVDHMGKLRPTNQYKGNKVAEVGEISNAMQVIAKEENVALVALHQLNRQVEGRENKRPQLADLRNSGDIEQDADLVVFVYREAYYIETRPEGEGNATEMERAQKLNAVINDLELLVTKNRHGKIGMQKLFCDVTTNIVRDV